MVNCRLLTPRVQHWLRNGRSARILHLFAESCNLVDDQNDVISLVTPRIGAGPFTLILTGDFTSQLTLSMPVAIDDVGQTLSIGSITLNTSNAVLWQPLPKWHQLSSKSLADLPPPASLPADIEAGLQRLLEGIVSGDLVAVQAGAYALAGRGIGLTPTGDDVLMGVLYGLWVWYPKHDWMQAIVETAVSRTTTLSAAFLRAAAAGEAVEPWHHLVNGRAYAIQNILSIGHTSGADALTGFARISQILGTRI
jgi:hypothetical protein